MQLKNSVILILRLRLAPRTRTHAEGRGGRYTHQLTCWRREHARRRHRKGTARHNWLVAPFCCLVVSLTGFFISISVIFFSFGCILLLRFCLFVILFFIFCCPLLSCVAWLYIFFAKIYIILCLLSFPHFFHLSCFSLLLLVPLFSSSSHLLGQSGKRIEFMHDWILCAFSRLAFVRTAISGELDWDPSVRADDTTRKNVLRCDLWGIYFYEVDVLHSGTD